MKKNEKVNIKRTENFAKIRALCVIFSFLALNLTRGNNTRVELPVGCIASV